MGYRAVYCPDRNIVYSSFTDCAISCRCSTEYYHFSQLPRRESDVMNTSVVSLIEREIASVDNLLYFESSSDTTGMTSITVTFKHGTDIKLAQMDLQNQIKIVESRLPQPVRQNGINVEAANSGFLMMVGLKSQNGEYQEADLSDYFARMLLMNFGVPCR